MNTLITQQTRSLNDMLSAERILRASSENTIRDLRQLLIETASRLDGERMEQIRRDDPLAPGNWTIAQWKKFMQAIPAAGSWGIITSPLASAQMEEQRFKTTISEMELVGRQLTAANQKLAVTEKERDELQYTLSSLANAGNNNIPVTTHSVSVPSKILDGSIAPWVFLLEEAKKIAKDLPKPCPPLQKTFLGGGRVGGDLQKAFLRVYVILYLIGKQRLCSAMELDALIGGATEASARSGSLRRVMDDLIEKDILKAEILTMSTPRTSLKTVRLSPKGERLYRDIFKSDPLENDWSRMIRLHEGAKQIEHTLSVLSFGMHARKRGYFTCILPDVKGNAAPDIWIARGEEALYVEVELSSKVHDTKWKNLAQLNDGCAAACLSSSRQRELFSSGNQVDQASPFKSGLATDIETLVKTKYIDVSVSMPLWMERW